MGLRSITRCARPFWIFRPRRTASSGGEGARPRGPAAHPVARPFAAGVASNIEVVQAQEAVAVANEQYISAKYGYDLAKGALIRGPGRLKIFFAYFSEAAADGALAPVRTPFTEQPRFRLAGAAVIVIIGLGSGSGGRPAAID